MKSYIPLSNSKGLIVTDCPGRDHSERALTLVIQHWIGMDKSAVITARAMQLATAVTHLLVVNQSKNSRRDVGSAHLFTYVQTLLHRKFVCISVPMFLHAIRVYNVFHPILQNSKSQSPKPKADSESCYRTRIEFAKEEIPIYSIQKRKTYITGTMESWFSGVYFE